MLTNQEQLLLTWCLRPRGYLIQTRGLPSSSSSFLLLASFSRFFCSSRSALVIRVILVWPACWQIKSKLNLQQFTLFATTLTTDHGLFHITYVTDPVLHLITRRTIKNISQNSNHRARVSTRKPHSKLLLQTTKKAFLDHLFKPASHQTKLLFQTSIQAIQPSIQQTYYLRPAIQQTTRYFTSPTRTYLTRFVALCSKITTHTPNPVVCLVIL